MKKILCSILFAFLLLNCSESQNDFTHKTYQETIIRLKQENDSIRKINVALKNELKKCDDWVNFLEEDTKN